MGERTSQFRDGECLAAEDCDHQKPSTSSGTKLLVSDEMEYSREFLPVVRRTGDWGLERVYASKLARNSFFPIFNVTTLTDATR